MSVNLSEEYRKAVKILEADVARLREVITNANKLSDRWMSDATFLKAENKLLEAVYQAALALQSLVGEVPERRPIWPLFQTVNAVREAREKQDGHA